MHRPLRCVPVGPRLPPYTIALAALQGCYSQLKNASRFLLAAFGPFFLKGRLDGIVPFHAMSASRLSEARRDGPFISRRQRCHRSFPDVTPDTACGVRRRPLEYSGMLPQHVFLPQTWEKAAPRNFPLVSVTNGRLQRIVMFSPQTFTSHST